MTPFFLTESVTLITKATVTDSPIIPKLHFYGIPLSFNDPHYPARGTFDPDHYRNWIQAQWQDAKELGWQNKANIPKGNYQEQMIGNFYFPELILDLIRKETQSPTGAQLDNIIIDNKNSRLIGFKIDLPIILWLNKKQLQMIASHREELNSNKNNLFVNDELEFLNVAQQFIEVWFVRNSLPAPEIVPGEEDGTGQPEMVTIVTPISEKKSRPALPSSGSSKSEANQSDWSRFIDLMRIAMDSGPLDDEALWDSKALFDKFPKSYFSRYEKQFGSFKQGPGSRNGLEWRKNPKFRRPRKTKQSK